MAKGNNLLFFFFPVQNKVQKPKYQAAVGPSLCGPPSRGVPWSEGPPDLVRGPGGHSVLFGPAGVPLAVGAEAHLPLRCLLRRHLGHEVCDGAAHVGRAGKGGGGEGVGGARGQGVVVGIFEGLQVVGLAAHGGGGAAGGAVLGRAPRGVWAGHGGRSRGQAGGAQRLHLRGRLWDRLLPRVSLKKTRKARGRLRRTRMRSQSS